MWRGGRIDHPAGEHDDFANAAAGAVVLAAQLANVGPLDRRIMAMNLAAPPATAGVQEAFYGGGGKDSFGRDAFGFVGGGMLDLGKRAFGG